MTDKRLVSVCIPCYRSAKLLPQVVADIRQAFLRHPEYDYEILLANDGSPDDTFAVIRALCAQDSRITGIDLSRNFGQNVAICALARYIRGDMAVFMDDDGQHPADGIFALLDKINEGCDLVYARFQHKKHSFFKRFTSELNRLLSEWTQTISKGIYLTSFIAWSAFTIAQAQQYHSPFPSMDTYLLHATTRIANVDIPHQERLGGQTGYTLKKLLSLWLTTFTSFSIVPLRFAAGLGFCFAGIGFVYGLFVVIRKLLDPSTPAGYTSIVALLLLIGGILMIILGLIGEYVGRIYMTISDKPQFVIRQVVNEKSAATEEENGR